MWRPRVIASQFGIRSRARAAEPGPDVDAVVRVVAHRRLSRRSGPVAPVVEEAVEVPLAEPIALVLGQRGVAAVLVTLDGERFRAHGAPPVVAHGKAEVEIRVAVEAEATVEAADLAERLAADGEAVALDRVDLAGRSVLELACVLARHAPAAGNADRRIVEGGEDRGGDVAGRLDATCRAGA